MVEGRNRFTGRGRCWLDVAGLLVALLLVGCNLGGRQENSTPAPLTATLAPSSVTSDLQIVPTTTPTLTPAPELAPTVRVSTPNAPSTAEPDIAATLTAGTAPRLFASYLSPDGARRAEVHIFDCVPFPGGEYAYDRLQIVDVVGGGADFIDGQLQACGGLGAFGLAGQFWSPSGRFFYYTTARQGVPDGCGYWTRPLSRVDLLEGSVAVLGGGPASPDGRLLAVWDERDLVVYDIDGGEIGRVEATDPAAALGPIAWSPDGRALTYLQAGAFCVPGASGMTTVAGVDFPSMSSRVWLRSADPAFQLVAWEEPETLLLEDDTGEQWRYDLAGGTLSAAP